MLQQLRTARKNESGFTLIELLIVIVILGVLSGIVVFAVSGIQDRGVAASCKSDVSTVEVAVEAYYAKVGSYPGANAWASLTTGANRFLKSQPTNTQYTVSFDAAGVVTALPACSSF
jgi:prepilin-type N-terminal cleavage/methylation domain-containing protein